jgi:hypothetical protein
VPIPTDAELDFREDIKNSKVLQNNYKDIELMNRLVFFSRTLDNDYFAWDSVTIPDKRSGELPIHFLPRLAETTSIVAGSFFEFVKKHFC